MLTETRVIDNIEVKTTLFHCMEALKLKVELLKIIGEPLIEVAGKVKDRGLKTDIEQLSGAFKDLMENIEPEKFVELVRKILKNTSVITENEKGEKAIFDLSDIKNIDFVFTGKLVTLYKILFFVLQVNYQDFFQILNKAG